MRGFVVRCVLSIALVISSSCGGDDEPPPPEDVPEQVEVEVFRDIVLTEDARFPELDTHFLSAEVFDEAARVVLTFSDGGPADPLAVGNVIAGDGDGGYLGRITAINEMGSTLEVLTDPAEIQELIADGHFRITAAPNMDQWVQVDDETAWSRTPITLGSKVSFIPTITLDNLVGCGGGSEVPLSLTPIFSIRPEFVFELNIRRRRILPELLSARFVLGGEIEVGYELGGGTSVSAACELNLLEAISRATGRPIPSIAFPTRVPIPVGPITIPITIRHKITPVLTARMNATAAIDTFNMKSTVTYGISAGAEYDINTGWSNIWDPRRETVSDVEDFRAGERVAFGFGMSLGAKDEMKLFRSVGPTITLTGNVDREFVLESDCSWDDSVKMSATGAVSAALEFELGRWIHISVASAELSAMSPAITLYEDRGVFMCDDPPPPPPPPPPPRDGGMDASMDAGVDSGMDSGSDSGMDAADADAGDTTDALDMCCPIDDLCPVNSAAMECSGAPICVPINTCPCETDADCPNAGRGWFGACGRDGFCIHIGV